MTVIIVLLLSTLAQAHAEDRSCVQLRTYHDFYHCSVIKHPAFSAAKLKVQEGEAVFEKSAQLKNPEVEVKSVSGENAGERIGSTELSLSIPLSQIWVNGAEREAARAEQRIAEIESKESLMKVKKEVLRDIYRFRQIEAELHLVIEAIESFEKIEKQFKGRRVRGPEQEITLNLVELAVGDYELKKNHLTTERAEILSRLKAIWGPKEEIRKEFLPPLKDKWPSVDSETNVSASFEVQRLVAESDRATAEEKIAARESLPELKAGPVAERTTEGPNQYWSYGFNVSMSVPLLSFNGGSRRLAETKAAQARFMSDYAQKKSQLERDILIQKYKSAVDSLKKSSSRNELTKKHAKIDSLFRQGLAAGALVIEAHRQITEFTESQHEHEMLALDSYVELMALSGKEIEEILK